MTPVSASSSPKGDAPHSKALLLCNSKIRFQEAIAEILSHPVESLDRKLLDRVVKTADLQTVSLLSPETLSKIEMIKTKILIPQAEGSLKQSVTKGILKYHQMKNPFPSSHKMTDCVLDKLADFYLSNYHLFSFETFVQKAGELSAPAFKNEGMKCLMTPQSILQILLTKALSTILESGHPPPCSSKSCLTGPASEALALIKELSTSLSSEYKNSLDKGIARMLTSLCRKLDNKFCAASPEKSDKVISDLFTFTLLVKEVRISTDLPQAFHSEVEKLAGHLSNRFLTLFKAFHSPLLKQGVFNNNLYLKNTMKLIASLHNALHGGDELKTFLHDFEEKLTQMITETFTPEILGKIEHSGSFSKTTKHLASAIKILSKFLDNEDKTLQVFVVCFDKIFIKLLGIRDSLNEPDPDDIIAKSLLDVLRGSVHIAVREFEKTDAAQSIDLSDPHILNLKKRLDILMSVVPKLLQSRIHVELTMKVKEDKLLARLFQLHSAAYGKERKTWKGIKKWINANKSYNFDGFSSWLRNKIDKKSPVTILENDYEITYAQFISETQ